jgi:hypothetical protein
LRTQALDGVLLRRVVLFLLDSITLLLERIELAHEPSVLSVS